jgi:hypothetical protein
VVRCSGGEEGAADAEAVLPTLGFIRKVFEDVQGTISTWCRPSRMGAAVTVLRNMTIASWYQVCGLSCGHEAAVHGIDCIIITGLRGSL